MYVVVAKLAISSTSPDVVTSTIQFFHYLINGEVDDTLDSKIFARSLVDFVHTCTTSATTAVDKAGESALIELLFETATKIRLDPGILTAWFYPERGPGNKVAVADVRRNQFPMFYVLVNHVHRDGPVGDFSRTALLYLTESAARSRQLEKWMMESDLAPQMASGLSALYSRLSRRAPRLNKEDMPLLANSDTTEEPSMNSESQETATEDIRAFLTYLAFWQDTLTHCHSQEVKDTLLDHYQMLFVEQLLYPSLLESSDVDEGSTAAVILHLCRILDAIMHPQMSQRMLDYLFASGSPSNNTKHTKDQQRMSLSRRTSLENLTSLMQLHDTPDPDLFSLHDLIIYSLRSPLPSTVASALKLITVLLQRHHTHVRGALFSLTQPDPSSRQNLKTLNSTMLSMFDCATTISQTDTMDQSYQAALRDCQIMLEQHCCLLDQLSTYNIRPASMSIAPSDKIYGQLCNLLGSWFRNDTLVNLELTGTFAALSACEHIHLASWLSPQTPAETELNAAGLGVLATISKLSAQVKSWREQFVEWDTFYSIQRVDLAGDNEVFSMSSSSTVFSERLSSNEKARSASGISKIKPGTATRNVSSGQISSIDGVLASSPTAGSASQSSDMVTDVKSESGEHLREILLDTRIPVGAPPGDLRRQRRHESSEASDTTGTTVSSGDVSTSVTTPESRSSSSEQTKMEENAQTASLRHVLTQAIILQEFILELAAALQIRATLFDEVELS